MDVEGCSNTMPCPMAIIQPLTPEGSSSKAVQSKTRGTFWKDSLVYGNVALHGVLLNYQHDRSRISLKALLTAYI